MNEATTENPIQDQDVNEQIALRRHKLAELRKLGNAFPNDFAPSHLSACLHAEYNGKSHDELEKENIEVFVAGRMMLRRLMGKASFAHIQDAAGQIQIYLKSDELPEHRYEQFKHWDIGDIVGVTGHLFKTKTNELSVKATEIKLLTKALRPLPDKFHGLSDQETRYRQRYLDLMMNQSTRETFQVRSKLIQAIRAFLLDRKYLEVETPMMQVIPGGATARPFETYHNALDMPLFLRIAPELYLKRLVVGGIERVFEINRNFRNEGVSTRHNPEFTMLEFYQAYATYTDLMDLTEDMLRYLSEKLRGSLICNYQGHSIDFSKPFTRMTVVEAVLKYNPKLSREDVLNKEVLTKYANSLKIDIQPSMGLGKIQLEVFDRTAEHELIHPTFITEYPLEVSPLARKKDDNPFVTDRFEFFIGGREIANGFSELNDPEDQDERFLEQAAQLKAGDNEAMYYDSDYITALEYGLPPTAGEGIGIDRLVMLFTDSPSIRDVILFPHMRPK